MRDENELELISACRILFGPEVQISPDFLVYVQLEGAKTAYRRRARASHPDAHPWAPVERRRQLHNEFSMVSHAYRTLHDYLTTRKDVRRLSAERPTRASYNHCNSQAEQPQTNELYYTGPVPCVELKFGRYLYYRGLVSYQEVLRALQWQREQRPSIGELSRFWGWLNEVAVHRILQAERVSGRFGERAMRLGLLSNSQVQQLLATQQQQQKRIGSYFVKRGLLQEAQLAVLDYERSLHNRAVADSDSLRYAN